MQIYTLNPLIDQRWSALVEQHPDASVFHTRGWLEALRRTYRYEPVVCTTCPPGNELTNGIVFCKVRSWVTGNRLVSLPFSDHCQPLVDRTEDLGYLLMALSKEKQKKKWKYIEFRPVKLNPEFIGNKGEFGQDKMFYHFKLDLSSDIDQIYRNIKSDIRKKMRRTERAGYEYEKGSSDRLITQYYKLQVMTRAKQRIPPQPLMWLQNLAECLPTEMEIHLLSLEGQPIAGLVALLFQKTLMWKYSASDPKRDKAGAGKLLMWHSICDAKSRGAVELDMGRCDPNNIGLVEFKSRWGSERGELAYYRTSARQRSSKQQGWQISLAKRMMSLLPEKAYVIAGKLIYRHLG